MMEIKAGDIVKHFKGKDLIEKNIYEILSINAQYTGTKAILDEATVVYVPLFQEGKTFIREYDDLVSELSDEEKELYNQCYRVEPLTATELATIKTDSFIAAKKDYIAKKYANNEKRGC